MRFLFSLMIQKIIIKRFEYIILIAILATNYGQK
jgi:hypothetical protein